MSFCAYCWRLGSEKIVGRRYRLKDDFNRGRAYCCVHSPRSELIARSHKGKVTKVIRKVLNQAEIQYGRKMSRLANDIERDVIIKDKQAAEEQSCVRAWVAGETIISGGNDQKWSKFVTLFFPYIAHSAEWSEAKNSPLEAFKLLEEDNKCDKMVSIHEKVMPDIHLLGLYLMPMMLRLDVWLEIEHNIANKKRKNKLDGFERRSWPKEESLK